MPAASSSPSPSEAWRHLRPTLRPLPASAVRLAEAAGHRLASPAVTPIDLPPFTRSAMDGVAVAATAVTAGVPLPRAAESQSGAVPTSPVAPGAAAPISTGAPLPPGTDAVVPTERIREDGAAFVLLDAPRPGDHVRHAGEDAARGDVLAVAGDRVTPALVGLLAAAGVPAVDVVRRPRVVLLVTGDELRPAGAPLGAADVPEANGPALRALLVPDAAAVDVRHVPDDAVALRGAIASALDDADVVLSTGGASVGAHDHVRRAAAALGLEELLWGVAVRPGAPTGVVRRADGRVLLALPGNPTAAHVVFLLLGRPLVRALGGDPGPEPHHVPVRLAASARGATGRVAYVPAALAWAADGRLDATPAAVHGAARAVPLAAADALLRLPPAAGRPPEAVPAGTTVGALLLDGRRPAGPRAPRPGSTGPAVVRRPGPVDPG